MLLSYSLRLACSASFEGINSTLSHTAILQEPRARSSFTPQHSGTAWQWWNGDGLVGSSEMASVYLAVHTNIVASRADISSSALGKSRGYLGVASALKHSQILYLHSLH